MYRQLARWYGNGAADQDEAARRVFDLHPHELYRFLDEAWFMGQRPLQDDDQSRPLRESVLESLRSGLETDLSSVTDDIFPLSRTNGSTSLPTQWQHLIYAYMVENTRIFEIFERVLHEYVHGERFEIASGAGRRWLRATEDLFYRDPPPFGLTSLVSSVRPDLRASRRNAYYRVFGMDLNHGAGDAATYAYIRPPASNTEFVTVFEEFLREVWRGIEHQSNSSGANPTDDEAISTLASRLADMLNVRRLRGNLDREEFAFTTMMSWFHLTVEFDSPIVIDLRAQATAPWERLRKLGERVGLPAHARSESYLRLAESMSVLLRQIEDGIYSDSAAVPALYTPGSETRHNIMTIITHWSLATGRDIKGRSVAAAPRWSAPTGNGARSTSSDSAPMPAIPTPA
jgi:hypothetical protein